MTTVSMTAVETTAGGSAMPLAVGDTAPHLEGVRDAENAGIKDDGCEAGTTVEDVDLKGGGINDAVGASMWACDAVSRAQHGVSPGGGIHSASSWRE